MSRAGSVAWLVALALGCGPRPAGRAHEEHVARFDAPDATRYSIELAIDPVRNRIAASGRVVIARPKPGEPILFVLSPAIRDFVLELDDARPVKTSRLATIGWGNVWKLDDVAPQTNLALRFRYVSEGAAMTLQVGGDVAFGHGDTTAWYPLFDSGGWAGHVGELAIAVPEGWTAHASGRPSGGRFVIDTPTVFSFAAARFTVTRLAPRAPDEPAIVAKLLRPRADIDAKLARLADIVRVLAREFGRYPFDELAIVEIPTARAKGFFMASASQIVITPSQYLDGELDVPNFAHEISHKWWGGKTVDRGDEGSSLSSEAMAQLGALLAVEALQGADRAREMRLDGPRYVAGHYDVETCLGYKVPVQSLRGYLVLSALGQDTSLLKASHALATSKGTLVLDLLRRTIGIDAFRDATRRFLDANSFRDVPWSALERALSAGRDLTWFYDQWFRRTGAPSFELAWSAVSGGVAVTIDQSEPSFRATLELDVTAGGRITTHAIEVAGPRTEARLAVGGAVTAVVLDPRRTVPRHAAIDRTEARALAACADPATAESTIVRWLETIPRPARDGERFIASYGLGHFAVQRGALDEAEAHLRAALAEPSVIPRLVPWVHVELARLAQRRGDPSALARSVAAAVRADAEFGRSTGAADVARALPLGQAPGPGSRSN